jgi:uncharacterized hydrophobic protein (TIGR00271 family)
MHRVSNFLQGKDVTVEEVATLQEKLLFDRTPVRERYVRFFILLFLATVIATYGVVSDSVATIIGAMIVAPLMTPIMAVSLSAVTGDEKNLIRSMMLVIAGTTMVVGSGYVLAAILPGIVQTAGNSSITSRTTPSLIDLVVALAAGAAGAFATSREDVSDALPGVAIAVSLVPPLSVVGVCLSARQGHLALGAFLLFITNFLAIVAAGLMVFAIMGYNRVAMGMEQGRTRKRTIVVVIIAILLICGPLGVNGYQVTKSRMLQQRATTAASSWLAGSKYSIYSVKADVGTVNIIIAGDGPIPKFDELLVNLGKTAGKAKVSLKVVPERTFEGTTTRSAP